MTSHDFKDLLAKKVPIAALDYCVALWEEYPFHFKLTRKRVSKLGDYCYDRRAQSHTITVNHDLNPYQFLITYVHEVAHRAVHRRRQKPHGIYWKVKFQDLMSPLLEPAVFPEDVLEALTRHTRNPKASTAADPALARILSRYDSERSNLPTLAEVAVGGGFVFRKRAFKKLEKKRTRAVCLDISNRKKYLISELAEVKPY